VGASSDLMESVDSDKRNLSDQIKEQDLKDQTEIYRVKVFLVYHKLKNTLDERGFRYQSAADFIRDLELMHGSLTANRGEVIAESRILPLIYKARTFGFHLASLDIRQNSAVLLSAVSGLLKASEVEDGFEKLGEEGRIKLLTREILKARPLVNSNLSLQPDSSEVLQEFESMRFGKESAGEETCNDYIISMSSAVSDVLTPLLFAKEAGLVRARDAKIEESRLDILPLFETIEDLRHAHVVMGNLFKNPAYAQHLKLRGMTQKIMIGYSDSNKDAGIVASSFELIKAQINLKKICDRFGVTLILFHGRGGSVSRGGGPLNQAILSQPIGTIEGKIKITEQGEMIFVKYSMPEIALRSIELTSSAVILSTAKYKSGEKNVAGRYLTLFEEISDTALIHYRELVTHPGFIEYFRLATPIDVIERIEIGSRPPSRNNGTDLKNLRTIYKKWEFFKALTDNVEMVLSKADMTIGGEYLRLSGGQGTAKKVFKMISEEYERSRRAVLSITGEKNLLDSNPSLQRSLQLRNPYIDPISLVQIKFLQIYRDEKSENGRRQEILDLLRSTVNGIAAGMRNTG
jgi:phosphoenolpyruvate carboxylase